MNPADDPSADAASPPPSAKPRLRRWLLGAGAVLAALVLAAGLGLAVLIPLTPSVDNVLKARDERPSVLLAADGSVLATLRRMNREWIALDAVPRHVVDALIATEDHRFWEHPGIDWRRSLAAVWRTAGGERQGGSTITQQLARNFFPEAIGRAPTATRKLKEMITAIKLERAYSKREILETYLNTVSFHFNAFGLEMAARTYFNKPARALGPVEGATLIGLLKGTHAYNPVHNPERARERRNLVLAQMVRFGKLEASQYERLRTRPLRLDFMRQDLDNGPAPHFADMARRWLASFGDTLGYDLYADGLVVRTTLDPRLQRAANQALTRQLDALQAVADVEWGRASGRLLSTAKGTYTKERRKVEPFAHFWATRGDLVDAFVRESAEYQRAVDAGRAADEVFAALRADESFQRTLRARKTRLEAGLVAIDPAGGEIRAWVGARDFALDSFDHVQQARRQPGSTFKPFVYAAALAAGMEPQQQFPPRTGPIRLPDGSVWKPRDAADARGEASTLEDGLVYSRNGVTAQLVASLGAERVARMARALGVRDSPLEPVPSLALGTSPVSLLEMTSAYATIAAQGQYQPPRWLASIADRQGKMLVQPVPSSNAPPERALEPQLAVQLIDMMRGVVDRGTGRDIRERFDIRADVAGKTGTTQNNADGWFVLMHPKLVAGAWVGFNDPRVSLRSDHWGQGAHSALPVIGDFMQRVLADGVIESGAEFPRTGIGARIEAAVRSVGDAIRRWLGIGAP